MDALSDFIFTQPNGMASVPGVFVIARYKSRQSTTLEFLYAGESADVKKEAARIMTLRKIDGFDNSVGFLVLQCTSPDQRTARLRALLSAGIAGK